MHYKIGTRGSKLALAQTELVRVRLAAAYPKDTFEVYIVKTGGDRMADQPLSEIGGKGLFVSELERLLLEGEIQLAVHSLKDVPMELPPGLVLARTWKREDARDVLLLREAGGLEQLPQNARIGTGSIRRACQLLQLRPDIQIVSIRGNVDTRIRRMQELPLDGLVLAAAGLLRLGREKEITEYFSPKQMIPAPAQGALAIELPGADGELLEKLNALSDEGTEELVRAERLFQRAAGGDCRLPVAAYAQRLAGGEIALYALLGDERGERLKRTLQHGASPEIVAAAAMRALRERT
ncbi:MAG: hydroxymethylbilane synthase [Muribaculaceae bacterium]|nr:hydroxymethylbilane synthase [Roseburia sp.]MCM1430055.1 hydroxymethylbilane synthase [Muribaculaceae bacterium]MCM1493872.1 hydroxymethylbilane synthase [Muribaculaceae bacterium]